MQPRCVIGILLVITPVLAAQAGRQDAGAALEQRGVTLTMNFSSDVFAGRGSGRTVASAGADQWLDLAAHSDFGRLWRKVPHTSAFVSVHVNGTVHPRFDDSAQTLSSIHTSPGIRVAELWVEHSWRASASVRMGRIDGNRDFAGVENAANFLNASYGLDPTFSTLPNYNSSRLGAELLMRRRRFHLNMGTFASEGTGTLLVEQAGYEWGEAGKGRVAVGGWQVTGKMPTFDEPRRGARGGYAIAEQRVWQHNREGERGPEWVAGFVQLGAAPAQFGPVSRHAAAGVVWQGPWARRDRDSAGFSVSRVTVSGDPATVSLMPETAWEGFYRIERKNLSVTPDVQYIRHLSPGGSRHGALVAGVRVALSFTSHAE